VIKLKKKEFQDLKQGSMSVHEYITKFTQLSHYASHEVDIDVKKHECFLNGLNDGLAYALEARDFENFQGMVNKALVLENRSGVMERKRKLVHQHQLSGSSKSQVAMSSAGPVFHPAQPQFQLRPQAAGQGFSTLQRQVTQCPNNLQTPAAGNLSVWRTQATQDPQQADRRCYNCGEQGHYTNRCPNPRTRVNQPGIATPAPTRGTNFVSVATKQNYARGRVNHVAVEEAQEAPNVIISMFLINDTSIVVLFDSGASHSFISAAYVGKHNLPLALLRCQLIVSSLGGDMPARHLCPNVNLKIRVVDFVANLIILESKGIDVILGMDWLSKYKVLIECAKKSIKLTTMEGKEMEFVTELVVTTKGVANRAKVNQLDGSERLEVPVVNEFPDVFLEELPDMPPDRDIEFVIELKPDTTPIYKTPYRMVTLELAELKEHIKELLEKGFI
jgi:hypothetical protein